MKKVLLVLLMIVSLNSYGQETWRTLSLGVVNGFNGVTSMTSVNAALYYEIKPGFAVNSWNQARVSSDRNWFLTQTTIDKRVSKRFVLGAGIMGMYQRQRKDVFAVVTVNYRIKL